MPHQNHSKTRANPSGTKNAVQQEACQPPPPQHTSKIPKNLAQQMLNSRKRANQKTTSTPL